MRSMMESIISQIQENIRIKQSLMEREDILLNIEKAVEYIVSCFKNGNKVLIFGNGGSAADAQHIAAEFTGRFILDRKALPAIAITTDSSALTSISNDYGFDDVFRRQIEGLANEGDVVVGISTSGKSVNILRAFNEAKRKGAYTIALLGKGGGECRHDSDISIIVPSDDTPRIQETHILIGHIICDLVEKELSKG
jgi:D-sedoheptulose 7-phosphate isomerase